MEARLPDLPGVHPEEMAALAVGILEGGSVADQEEAREKAKDLFLLLNSDVAYIMAVKSSISLPVYDASKKLLTIFFEYRCLGVDEEKEYGTKNVQDAIITKIKDAVPSQMQEDGLKAALNKIVNKETESSTSLAASTIRKHLEELGRYF